MLVSILSPFGFCEGVVKALQTAQKARSEHPSSPIFLLGALVHNEPVIAELTREGFVICDEKKRPLSEWIASLKEGSVVVFSAHGHDPKFDAIAKQKHLVVYDATCRFVLDNASLIRQELAQGTDVIYIGELNHSESAAALAISPEKIHLFSSKTSFEFGAIRSQTPLVISQTTMSAQDVLSAEAAIKAKFPKAKFADKRCVSTEQRQKAVLNAPKDVDLFVIMGSKASNNTDKLVDIAKLAFPKAVVIRVLDLAELKTIELTGHHKVALASGASTSPADFESVYHYIYSIK
jgi:4-hydroxy-3-methylbut-2-enyl diphosphate reductase